MTKVNRHRTYGTTPEWRIIAKSLIEPGMGTGRPLLNCDLHKPVKLNARPVDVDEAVPKYGLGKSPQAHRISGQARQSRSVMVSE